MDMVQVAVPAVLFEAAELDHAHLSEETARLLALELFGADEVSLSRAARSMWAT
jgi:predicted HTH domain antitoxin